MTPSAELEAALLQASREIGLQSYYIDIVRPVLSLPVERWPTCCGRGCEPCMLTITRVAARVHELMGRRPP